MNLWQFYKDNPDVILSEFSDKNYPNWTYYSGSAGTVVIPANHIVISLSAYAASGGTLTINGGSPVILPAGVSISISPRCPIIAPTIVFSNTSTYFVEVAY